MMTRHKYLFILIGLFMLISLACGELVVPVEQGVGEQPSAIQPDGDSRSEALPTLAPMPESAANEQENEISQEEIVTSGAPDYMTGDVGWSILQAVDLGSSLDSGDADIPDLTANGHLIALRFTVENSGTEVLTFIGLDLEDNAGNRYGYLGDSLEFIVEEEICETVELEPGVMVLCTAIYDVPADVEHLYAVLSDLNLLSPQEQLVELEFVQ